LKLAPACAPFKRFNTTSRHHPKAALGDATNDPMEEENFIDERFEDCIQNPVPTPIKYYKLCDPNPVDPDIFARFCANL
jgi:hypothetical protein